MERGREREREREREKEREKEGGRKEEGSTVRYHIDIIIYMENLWKV